MNLAKLAAAAVAALSSCAAFAGEVTVPNAVPEPEMWLLLAVAGVVGGLVHRKRK